MDEKWVVRRQKEKNCDADDPEDRVPRGSAGITWRSTRSTGWSVAVIPEERTAATVHEWSPTSRNGWRAGAPALITTDEYAAYEGAILETFGDGGGAA